MIDSQTISLPLQATLTHQPCRPVELTCRVYRYHARRVNGNSPQAQCDDIQEPLCIERIFNTRTRKTRPEVTSGLYQTASEVIREALRLLRNATTGGRLPLREQIQKGLTQLDQGADRWTPPSPNVPRHSPYHTTDEALAVRDALPLHSQRGSMGRWELTLSSGVSANSLFPEMRHARDLHWACADLLRGYAVYYDAPPVAAIAQVFHGSRTLLLHKSRESTNR